MFLTKLAFKNLVRHRNRTVITAVIIAFAIFFFILMDSLIGGMTEMSYENIINYEAGHLQILTQEYKNEEEELPLENLFVMNQNLVDIVENVDGYRASFEELNFSARLSNGRHELPVIGKGITPSKFESVFSFNDNFVEGEMFSEGQHRAVMGKKLAELLELERGDYFTLLVKDKNETFNTIEAEIAGLVHTGNPQVNSNIVYLPLDVVQGALNVNNEVSKVIVTLEDKDLAGEVAPKVKEKLQNIDSSLTATAWEDLEAVSVAGAKNMGNKLILAIILIIAAISIINTVILAALERMEEIGMMKAMGLQRKEIIYTFVLESTGIGLLGGIIGLLLGAAGVTLFKIYGLDFGAMIDTDMSSFGIPVIDKIYGVWNPESFIFVFAFGIIVSILASILPAYWAASKDPVAAIHHR